MAIRKAKKKGRLGRPKRDPNAPLPPTLPIEHAAKRYGIGRDQVKAAAIAGEIAAIKINGKFRIVRSKADEQFGLAS
jgi:hypothetical protein